MGFEASNLVGEWTQSLVLDRRMEPAISCLMNASQVQSLIVSFDPQISLVSTHEIWPVNICSSFDHPLQALPQSGQPFSSPSCKFIKIMSIKYRWILGLPPAKACILTAFILTVHWIMYPYMMDLPRMTHYWLDFVDLEHSPKSYQAHLKFSLYFIAPHLTRLMIQEWS